MMIMVYFENELKSDDKMDELVVQNQIDNVEQVYHDHLLNDVTKENKC